MRVHVLQWWADTLGDVCCKVGVPPLKVARLLPVITEEEYFTQDDANARPSSVGALPL